MPHLALVSLPVLSSFLMDVFVIPVAKDGYELYCEPAADVEEAPEAQPQGFVARLRHRLSLTRLRHRFAAILRAAEQRQLHRAEPDEPKGWVGRLQDRMMAWIVERIAEQRLLWNLRGKTGVVAVHPPDMTFDQVMTLIRRTLQRDYERHRLWLVIDATIFVVSGALALVPGPNLLAYYFLFRVGGHWFSMRGARQGLDRVAWTGRSCPPLTELRDVSSLDPSAREQRIHDIATRLRLQHLSSFFERIAVRHA